MSAAMLQGVLTLLMLVIAVCTFLFTGRQWPTFITAALFGVFFGNTSWGAAITSGMSDLVRSLIEALS